MDPRSLNTCRGNHPGIGQGEERQGREGQDELTEIGFSEHRRMVRMCGGQVIDVKSAYLCFSAVELDLELSIRPKERVE